MEMKKRQLLSGMLAISILLVMFLNSALAGQVTIVGEVNDTYQIVAEGGQIYEVTANEIGNEVVFRLISRKVKVTGTVKEEGEVKIITISSYEVLAE